MKAQEEHILKQKQALEDARAKQNLSKGNASMNDGGKSLFDVNGSKNKAMGSKLQVEKVAFSINISCIGASLQL